jgi:hypothetical protein
MLSVFNSKFLSRLVALDKSGKVLKSHEEA